MFEFKAATPATLMEVHGRSISDQSHLERRNFNVKGLGALDLRTTKSNGEPWNCCLKADRQAARDLLNRSQPDWVIGAPPCMPFSIWNHGIQFEKNGPSCRGKDGERRSVALQIRVQPIPQAVEAREILPS